MGNAERFGGQEITFSGVRPAVETWLRMMERIRRAVVSVIDWSAKRFFEVDRLRILADRPDIGGRRIRARSRRRG